MEKQENVSATSVAETLSIPIAGYIASKPEILWHFFASKNAQNEELFKSLIRPGIRNITGASLGYLLTNSSEKQTVKGAQEQDAKELGDISDRIAHPELKNLAKKSLITQTSFINQSASELFDKNFLQTIEKLHSSPDQYETLTASETALLGAYEGMLDASKNPKTNREFANTDSVDMFASSIAVASLLYAIDNEVAEDRI